MKNIIITIAFMCISTVAFGQNIIIQQNNSPTQQTIVREKQVPVYIKEQPSKPMQPICLLGYLYVYPDNIGKFETYPAAIINSINTNKTFGRNNWRLPTWEELMVIKQYYKEVGINAYCGNWESFYMHQYNGKACICSSHIAIDGDYPYHIRLVSTN